MPPLAVSAVPRNADEQFHAGVRELFPDSYEFESHYVEYEFAHIGKMFESDVCPVAGATVLEFGCNIGATSVVLAHYGANVTAVDIDPRCVELARLNAERYGVARKVRCDVLAPGEPLPFPDSSFDVVTSNSVLEYVEPKLLPHAQREMDRVLKPGGLLLVFGTSNRLWPLEAHSKRWLVNYIPRGLDRLLAKPLARGVWPGRLRRGFGPGYDDLLVGQEGARRYAELKRQMGAPEWRLRAMRLAAPAFAMSPWSIGLVMPYATLLLRKRGG